MAVSLANKVFTVTGAASGMGLATAKLLLARDASVGLTDINSKGLHEFYDSLDKTQKAKVLVQAIDITDRKAVKGLLDATKDKFGHLNGIANVAGTCGKLMGSHQIWQTPDEEYDLIMNTNVRGIFNFLREALAPGYLEPSSSIVNISSLYGLKGAPQSGPYCTSKHAIIGLTRAAAREAGPSGNIRVNAVCPGAVFTPLMQTTAERFGGNPVVDTPIPRVGDASEIASTIVYLLGPESSFVTGAVWAVDGGASC
ncbi:oxidoreductase [Aspergillus pseudoustus]|uniref:Oxidoreductase n=1 Tax=Aspergillus pseudoustus TaxID=1810923 RepID=A0ABR4IRK2_9EURO